MAERKTRGGEEDARRNGKRAAERKTRGGEESCAAEGNDMTGKSTAIIAAAALCALVLAGCGAGSKTYADGTYEGRSSLYTNDDGTDEGNGYGVVTLTVSDNIITECIYLTYEPDGTLKDEDYGKEDGKIANKDYYTKAQRALAACDRYAAQLVEEGTYNPKEIDTISGATINYNHFLEAVEAALSQAEETG